MALDYIIAIATANTPAMTAELVDTIGVNKNIFPNSDVDRLLGSGVKSSQGMHVSVKQHTSPAWGDLIEEEFGFLPTVTVYFRLDKTSSLTRQGDDIASLAAEILRQESGDFILYFMESGDVWAFRRGGDLTISESDYIWTDTRLPTLPTPYTRKNLTFE
ncbi:SitI3 family protein [Nocardia sp. NPDC058640]|uniref:SitI3 family protein n=1 Tax=Nocardia sp. NPDC058640 TaxID=3346571 RepID=UPI0036568F56